MEAFGYGTKRMAGDGPKKESFPTSLDGVIQAGFTSKGNSTDGSSFTITQPSHLNKLMIGLSECKPDRIATLNRPLCYNQLVK